jgi:hypothetical protein
MNTYPKKTLMQGTEVVQAKTGPERAMDTA